MLLTMGRLVEDTEGSAGVWFVYVVCGLGAALASFALSPRNSVSVGASGAIFGLFAVSVLSRLAAFNIRRFLVRGMPTEELAPTLVQRAC